MQSCFWRVLKNWHKNVPKPAKCCRIFFNFFSSVVKILWWFWISGLILVGVSHFGRSRHLFLEIRQPNKEKRQKHTDSDLGFFQVFFSMVEILCGFRILSHILVGGSHFGRSRHLFLEIILTVQGKMPKTHQFESRIFQVFFLWLKFHADFKFWVGFRSVGLILVGVAVYF